MERENKEHRDWLRERDCASCGKAGPSSVHHFIGEGGLSGMGMKAPDIAAMPLCYRCHRKIHDAVAGWKEKQRNAFCDTILQAIKEGRVKGA